MMSSMAIAGGSLFLVCLANMTNTAAESWTEWLDTVPKYFWLYNGLITYLFMMLGMVNLTFIYAAGSDFNRRNFVSTLLN